MEINVVGVDTPVPVQGMIVLICVIIAVFRLMMNHIFPCILKKS